jgi:hypothetical protein
MKSLRWVGALVLVTGLVVLSGATGAHAATPSWVFTPRSGSTPLGRVFAAGAGSPDGLSSVFYGGEQPGSGAGTSYADTWVHSSAGWQPRCGTTHSGATAPCGPGPASGAGMATGPHGVLLFGGFTSGLGGNAQGDLWQWNGSAWTRLCTTTTCGLGARGLVAMAGNGKQVVLYGGLSATLGGIANDTWLWNGSVWKQTCGTGTAITCGPGPLAGASMAWDGTRFVLFGGIADFGGTSVPTDATWTFDGTRWVRTCSTSSGHPCGPPARALGAFAYARDTTSGGFSGAVLAEGGNLFGPSTSTNTLYRDAWLWRGHTWTKLHVPWSGPAATFPNSGNPAPGPQPLLGAMASEPGNCELTYLGARVTASTPANVTVASATFVGSRPRGTAVLPSTCVTPAARTSPAAKHSPVFSAEATSEALAASGSPHVGLLVILGVALIGAGGVSTAMGAQRRRAPGRHLR